MIERLRRLNPDIPFHTVHDPEFKVFGSVIEGYDTREICEACEKIAMPAEGSSYVLSEPSLEALEISDRIKKELFGGLDAQIGLCWGYSSYLNALEFHKSSEINIAARHLVLLLALRSDMEGNELDVNKIRAFFVDRGEIIEVYGTSLHFCPCMTEDDGFYCVVGLHKGTNDVLDAPAEDPLLFKKNKWLICCDTNDGLKARNVYPGIHGTNYKVNY